MISLTCDGKLNNINFEVTTWWTFAANQITFLELGGMNKILLCVRGH